MYMKILYYIDGLKRGGKERRLVELLKHIKKTGEIDFELILMSNDIQYPEVHDLGIPIHFLIRKLKKDPRILYHLFKLCNRVKPEIIHTWDSMTSIYAVPIAKVLGIKLVNGMITDSFYNNKMFERGWIRTKITFPFSDVIVANSLSGLRAYKAPEKKSGCIYNGFDPNRIQNLLGRDVVKKKFNIDTPKVVGMVASFTERKDYKGFILSAENILKERNDVTFLAIGDGVMLEECKSMIHGHNKDKIKFLGLQSHIESIVNIMDVGVLTTNVENHAEGISNTILEYMALGKPVIATDSGGTKEIVVDGETGFLIQPNDVSMLTSKLIEFLDNPTQGTEMGCKGKQRVFEGFTLEIMASKYLQMYQECIKKKWDR
jgi:glycosyltransferase involved in cell wall biosynthesis